MDPLVAREALLDLDVEAFAASWLTASMCARCLHGGLWCAPLASDVVRGGSWLAIMLSLNDQGPSQRSYGSQEIVEPYSIPE